MASKRDITCGEMELGKRKLGKEEKEVLSVKACSGESSSSRLEQNVYRDMQDIVSLPINNQSAQT